MKEYLEHGLLEFFSSYSYNESALSEIRDLFETGKKDHFERAFLRHLEEDINIYAEKSLGLDEEIVKLVDIKDIANSIRIKLESIQRDNKEYE